MNNANVLTYKGYLAEITFDTEAKLFYARVINTRDTVTFQSDDAKALEREFHVSVDTYLEFCQELGETPDKPYSVFRKICLTPLSGRASVCGNRRPISQSESQFMGCRASD